MEIIKAGVDPNGEGAKKFEVTQGAYNSIYKNLGFVPVDDSTAAQQPAASTPPPPQPAELTEDEKFLVSFAETPFGQWSKEDTKKAAELLGADTSGADSFTAAKDIVKAALVEKGLMKSA